MINQQEWHMQRLICLMRAVFLMLSLSKYGFIFIKLITIFIKQLQQIQVTMSNLKQLVDQQYKRFSFSQSDTPYQNLQPSLDQSLRQPLKQSQLSKNYTPSLNYILTFPKDNAQNLRYNTYFTPRQRPTISVEQLLEEIKRLNQVISNLCRDNQMLKQQYSSLKFEMSGQMQRAQKQKQILQGDICLLKEMLNDKISQVESCEKTACKERQLIQKQCDRLTNQVKSIIEKKNDEIFSITREKDSENQSLKRSLQTQIQELKKQQKNTTSSFQQRKQDLEQEIRLLKQKQEKYLEQMDKMADKSHQQKLRAQQQQQYYVNELKLKYHQFKIKMIQNNKQEIAQTQKMSQLQKAILLSEIQQLNSVIQRQSKQNQQLKQIYNTNKHNYQLRLNQYERIKEELQSRLKKFYQQKNQQIEILKVKSASIHLQDLKNIQNISSSKVTFLSNKIDNLEKQQQNLHYLLELGNKKILNLIQQKQKSVSKAQQQIDQINLAHAKTQRKIKDQTQTQKAFFAQQIQQVVKINQIQSNQISSYQVQLQKLRRFIEEKNQQNRKLQNQLQEKEDLLNQQRQKFRSQILQYRTDHQQITEAQQQQIHAKNQQIQSLNDKIYEALSKNNQPQIARQSLQINRLKSELKDKVVAQENYKDKLQSLQRKIQELKHQQTRTYQLNSAINNSVKIELQALFSQKLLSIQELYQKKIQFSQSEHLQLKQINASQSINISSLKIKCQQLEANLRQIIESLQAKSDLQTRIIQLGQDNNLIKNKQELFQQ